MEKKDFFEKFVALLLNIKERFELDNIHDALIVWFGENYLRIDVDEVRERIINDKHAEGVDSILIDHRNHNLIFIQAKTVDNFANTQKNFRETDLKSTLEGVRFLLTGDYKGKITPELENLTDEYHELDRMGDYNTKIIFLILNKEPTDYKFIEDFKKAFPDRMKVCFCDFDSLFDFYVNKYLVLREEPPKRISFEVLSNLLTKETPNKSRVFSCKAKELAKIYNDYRERIFQQNVRYSLGLKSKSINRQILETAVDDKKNDAFWYFNNGITIVCKGINATKSGKVINLDYAQIINGAQTTYALHDAYKDGKLKDKVEILIKAIESDDKNFIESVTLYTNSQNAIRLRDLCSNDEIQIKTQKILIGSYRHFYERKRGEFESLNPTSSAKRKLLGEDYKAKIISNENAAQAFLAMFLNKPAQAKSEKRRIFMKDGGFYEDIFVETDNLLAEKHLMAWKLLKYIENYKKEYSKKYKVAETLGKKEMLGIYKYDFLLHSEYFILNIFKDYLKNEGFDVDKTKNDLLTVVSKIESNHKQIQSCYEIIKNEFSAYLSELKKQPNYYHNKFFKNERSIGLVRNFLNPKYNFVEII